MLKICTPFIDCLSEIHDTQVDNTNDLELVMLKYSLVD